MLAASPTVDEIGQALAGYGLTLRGGWQPDPQGVLRLHTQTQAQAAHDQGHAQFVHEALLS